MANSKLKTKQIEVPVTFTGTVTVEVPADLTEEDAQLIADKKALAFVLATVENPDAPELEAFEDAAEETSLPEDLFEGKWDDTTLVGVSGTWSSTRVDDE